MKNDDIMSLVENDQLADEAWIRERWGGFTDLVIGRNEEFSLDFFGNSLWLHCETQEVLGVRFRGKTRTSRLLLIEKPTRQHVIDAERMFGCSDER